MIKEAESVQEQKIVFFSEMPPGERLEREKNVYALLQRLGIHFVGIDHPAALKKRWEPCWGCVPGRSA